MSRRGECALPTCVSPHRQVLVLLDVQHDLQPVAGAALHGGAQRLALLEGVEHVALPVPGEHLRGATEEIYVRALSF